MKVDVEIQKGVLARRRRNTASGAWRWLAQRPRRASGARYISSRCPGERCAISGLPLFKMADVISAEHGATSSGCRRPIGIERRISQMRSRTRLPMSYRRRQSDAPASSWVLTLMWCGMIAVLWYCSLGQSGGCKRKRSERVLHPRPDAPNNRHQYISVGSAILVLQIRHIPATNARVAPMLVARSKWFWEKAIC